MFTVHQSIPPTSVSYTLTRVSCVNSIHYQSNLKIQPYPIWIRFVRVRHTGVYRVPPAVEWGRVTDYDAIHVKGTLARPFTTGFGTVTPFAEVGWFDNSLKNAKSVYANNVLDNTVVYNVGLRLSF